MKKLYDILSKDIKKENLEVYEIIIISVIIPLSFVLIIGFADWILKSLINIFE